MLTLMELYFFMLNVSFPLSILNICVFSKVILYNQALKEKVMHFLPISINFSLQQMEPKNAKIL